MKNLKDESRIDNIRNRDVYIFCLGYNLLLRGPRPNLETNLFVGDSLNYNIKNKKSNKLIKGIVNL